MAYTFNKLANNNIDVLENGKSIYGAGTPGVSTAYAKTLGYSDAPADPNASAATIPSNTGSMVSAPTPDVSTPSPIVYSADALDNPSTLFKNPNAPIVPNYSAMVSSVPTIDSIASQQSPEQIAAKAEGDSLSSRILDTLKSIGTKSVFQSDQEAQAGIPDLQKNLTDVNAEIQVLQNEAQAVPLQREQESVGTGRTVAGVQPLEASDLRKNTIKALTLSSIAETYRGNLSNAQAQVDRAVAAEFDPKQADLDYLKAALQINASRMTDADREEATVISAKLQERQDTLDQQKADRENSLKLVLTAAQNGAPAALLTKASTQSPTDAAATLQTYLKAPDDAFTLSGGQRRYDANGKLIASAPFEQQVVSTPGSGAGTPGTLLAQPAYKKLTAAQQGKADSMNNIVTQLNVYRDSLDKSVGPSGVLLAGVDSSALQAQYNSAIFALAQAVGTGALQEADRRVISNIIPNPTQLSVGTVIGGGKAGQLSRIDTQIKTFTDNLSGYGLTPTYTASDVSGNQPDIGDAFDQVVYGNGSGGTSVAPKSGATLPGDSWWSGLFSSWF